MTIPRSSPRFRFVLDTNVVLDWLVFDDSSIHALRDAVRDGTVSVLVHAAALGELERVLDYPKLELNATDKVRVLDAYRALASLNDIDDQPPLPPGFPRCSDRDDDHFIAFAYWSKADALVSRDTAVLNLKKRAAKFDVTIVDVRQMTDLLLRSPPTSEERADQAAPGRA